MSKVTQMPSELLWNRYGDQPEVLMIWNTYYANNMDWQYDAETNTKKSWHLSYESSFIAAVKGSKLIDEWLDVLLDWIVTPYEEVDK